MTCLFCVDLKQWNIGVNHLLTMVQNNEFLFSDYRSSYSTSYFCFTYYVLPAYKFLFDFFFFFFFYRGFREIV